MQRFPQGKRESDALETCPLVATAPPPLPAPPVRSARPVCKAGSTRGSLPACGFPSWGPPSVALLPVLPRFPPCPWSGGGTNSLQSPLCRLRDYSLGAHALGFRDRWCKKWPLYKPCLYDGFWSCTRFLAGVPYLKVFRSNSFMSSGLRKGRLSWYTDRFAPVRQEELKGSPFRSDLLALTARIAWAEIYP